MYMEVFLVQGDTSMQINYQNIYSNFQDKRGVYIDSGCDGPETMIIIVDGIYCDINIAEDIELTMKVKNFKISVFEEETSGK